MNVVTMNISAGIIIFLTFLLRKKKINDLPHFIFWLLWLTAIVRLVIPFSITSEISAFNLFYKLKMLFISNYPYVQIEQWKEVIIECVNSIIPLFVFRYIVIILWVVGFALVSVYFLAAVYNGRNLIKDAKVLQNAEHIHAWINQVSFLRKVLVLVSDDTKTPLSLGIFRPKIILPSSSLLQSEIELKQIILHECFHLKYFHFLIKLICMVIACVFWFNPLVWILYFYIERDMEITCDNNVIKMVGVEQREFYARNLMGMIGVKGENFLIPNSFNKSCVEERIVVIMNLKKMSMFGLVLSLAIPFSVATVFATTNVAVPSQDMQDIAVSVKDVPKLDIVGNTTELELSKSDIEDCLSQDNTRASRYLIVDNYKYVSYGSIPSSIKVTYKDSGYTYTGTLTLDSYVRDMKTDLYTGYYSGKIYR